MIQFRGGYQSLVFIIAQEQILERFPPPFITVCLLFTGIWCQKLIMTQLQTSWRNWWKRAFWVWIMLRSGNVIRDHVCFHWLGLRKIRHTNFPPVKRVDSTSCAVVNQDVSGPVRGGNVSEQADSITLKKKTRGQKKRFFMSVSNLLNLCEPEYQAAASVALMTTSTGTRSATASLDALIVRRMPLPAWTRQRKD